MKMFLVQDKGKRQKTKKLGARFLIKQKRNFFSLFKLDVTLLASRDRLIHCLFHIQGSKRMYKVQAFSGSPLS
jgi:hypothetical protein